MKKFWLVGLLLALVTSCGYAQFYNPTVESGDTLISNTVDTTEGCLIYNTSVDDRRPARPTIFIDADEIGTNSTHYWLEIEIDIASGRTLPAKASDSWYRVYRRIYSDWFGVGSGNQQNIVIPLAFLEPFAPSYFRVILVYPYGESTDSTAYAVYLGADENNNVYSPNRTTQKILTHYDIFGTTSYKAINGQTPVTSYPIPIPIEIWPGQFQLPDRAIVTVMGDVKADDDSVTIYVKGYHGKDKSNSNIDTLTIGPLNDAVYSSAAMDLTLNHLDAVEFTIYQEENAAADSTYIYVDIQFECDP